jgi:hypothetical protein
MRFPHWLVGNCERCINGKGERLHGCIRDLTLIECQCARGVGLQFVLHNRLAEDNLLEVCLAYAKIKLGVLKVEDNVVAVA